MIIHTKNWLLAALVTTIPGWKKKNRCLSTKWCVNKWLYNILTRNNLKKKTLTDTGKNMIGSLHNIKLKDPK